MWKSMNSPPMRPPSRWSRRGSLVQTRLPFTARAISRSCAGKMRAARKSARSCGRCKSRWEDDRSLAVRLAPVHAVPQHCVDSLITRGIDGWIPWTPCVEQSFHHASELAFRMPLLDCAIVDRKAKRRGVIDRIHQVHGMAALDQQIHKIARTLPGGIV